MSSSSDWGPTSPKANSPWSSGSSEPEGHHDIKFPDGTKWSSSKSSTPVTSERWTNTKTPTMPARGQDQPACPSPSDPWQQQREEPRATRGMQEPRTRQANLREKERHAAMGPRQQVRADSPRRQLAFESARNQGQRRAAHQPQLEQRTVRGSGAWQQRGYRPHHGDGCQDGTRSATWRSHWNQQHDPLTARAAPNEQAAQPMEERIKRLEEMVLLRVPALEAEVEHLKGVLKLQTEQTGGPTTWASKQQMTMSSQTPSPSSRRWRRSAVMTPLKGGIGRAGRTCVLLLSFI